MGRALMEIPARFPIKRGDSAATAALPAARGMSESVATSVSQRGESISPSARPLSSAITRFGGTR